MEENFDIREQQLTTKERDFENALRPLNFEDFSGQVLIGERKKSTIYVSFFSSGPVCNS